MRKLWPLLVTACALALSTTSCETTECIDCVNAQGIVLTFCDPPENPIDSSLTCGSVYEK